MQMPGRSYTAPNAGYRYGFNGKENDNDVKGNGNQQDYGMRIYDPRLGRFLSVDPLADDYPFYTPYQFASNTPIKAIDIDGLESSEKLNENERPAWGQKGFVNLAPYKLESKSYSGGFWNNLNAGIHNWVFAPIGNGVIDAIDAVGNPGWTVYNFYDGGTQALQGFDAWYKQHPDLINGLGTELGKSVDYIKENWDNPELHIQTAQVIYGIILAKKVAPANGNKVPTTSVVKPVAGALTAGEQLAAKYSANRPKHKQSTINKVWENSKSADGNVYDVNSGRLLTWDKMKPRNGQWDMGHKPEYKYEFEVDKLRKGELTEAQFLERYHNPNSYNAAGVYENRSRKGDPKKPL